MFCGTGVYTPFAFVSRKLKLPKSAFSTYKPISQIAGNQKSQSCCNLAKLRFSSFFDENRHPFSSSLRQRSNTLDFAGRKVVCQRGIANKPNCLRNRFFAFSVPLLDYPRQLKSSKIVLSDFNRNCRIVSYCINLAVGNSYFHLVNFHNLMIAKNIKRFSLPNF